MPQHGKSIFRLKRHVSGSLGSQCTRKILAENLKGPLICHFELVKPSFWVWHVGFAFTYSGSLFRSDSATNDRSEPHLIYFN